MIWLSENMSLMILLCSFFSVFVLLKPDTHGLPAALSKKAWIIVIMPDGTAQLTTRKKLCVERITLATLCIFGQVTFDQRQNYNCHVSDNTMVFGVCAYRSMAEWTVQPLLQTNVH